MKPTEPRQPWSPTPPVREQALQLEAALEVVRQSFYARLRDETTRLASLAVALRASEADTGSVFDELETFAHRLRGAAAVFDVSDLSDAAKTLELAAAAASAGRAPRGDSAVCLALERLANQLASMSTGESIPCVVSER